MKENVVFQSWLVIHVHNVYLKTLFTFAIEAKIRCEADVCLPRRIISVEIVKLNATRKIFNKLKYSLKNCEPSESSSRVWTFERSYVKSTLCKVFWCKCMKFSPLKIFPCCKWCLLHCKSFIWILCKLTEVWSAS